MIIEATTMGEYGVSPPSRRPLAVILDDMAGDIYAQWVMLEIGGARVSLNFHLC